MKTILDYDVRGKKVILRCDLNVPIENGIVLDDTRVVAALKTINYLIKNDAKIIVLSHLGKIKTKDDLKKNSLYPVYLELKKKIDSNVYYCDKTRGMYVESMVSKLNNRDILLLENTRYEDLDGKKESNCDMDLAKYWASLGDIFINDAYGTLHRKHASNVGIAKYLPNGIGFLIQEEITKIDSFLDNNSRPFVVIMGGKKVNDKIKVIDNLITKCDYLLVGGAMSFTFLYTKGYKINEELVDKESITYCKNLLNKYSNKIVLPSDFKTSISLDSDRYDIKDIYELNNEDRAYDIGPASVKLFNDYLKEAKKVLVNGPMGVFENKMYRDGTKYIYKCLVDNKVMTLVGGGDSASSVNNLGFRDCFYHVSTGGGATLKYLENNSLPGLDVINK